MKTTFSKGFFASLIIIAGLATESCSKKASPEKQTAETINVILAQAHLKEYPTQYSFSGRLEAGKQSNLSTRIMGTVEQISAKPGQRVNRGDTCSVSVSGYLAKAQVEANLIEAQSAFDNAKKDLERFEALYKSKSTSDKEMDDIRTRYQMAKARFAATEQMEKEAGENLLYSVIRAPYNGVITGKFVQEGDMANPGMPLLSIENPDQWLVVARSTRRRISIQLNEL